MSRTKNEASATRDCKGFGIKNHPTKEDFEVINSTTTPARKATPARTEMFPGVPYITHPIGEPYGDANFFDVPDEQYGEGNRTGILVAAQLFKFERDVEQGVLLPAIHAAAALVQQSYQQTSDATRFGKVGAAVGFLETIEDILQQACSKLDLAPLIASRLSYFEQAAEQDLKEMRDQNAALMSLMRLPEQISPVKLSAS